MKLIFTKDDKDLINSARHLILDNIEGILKNEEIIKNLIKNKVDEYIKKYFENKNVDILINEVIFNIIKKEIENIEIPNNFSLRRNSTKFREFIISSFNNAMQKYIKENLADKIKIDI